MSGFEPLWERQGDVMASDPAPTDRKDFRYRQWLRYWPAALFVLCNLGVLAMVHRARRIYEGAAELESSWQAESDWRRDPSGADWRPPETPEQFGLLPMLKDWNTRADAEGLPITPGDDSGSLLRRVGRELARASRRLDRAAREKERAEREALLMRRPLRFNFYTDADGNPSYLGHRTFLAPLDFKLPPVSPTQPLEFADGTHRARLYGAGEDHFNVVIDPEVFRDPEAMQRFVAGLTRDLVSAGLQPQIRIAARPEPTTAAGETTVASARTATPLAPSRVPRATDLNLDRPLPKPPADAMTAVEPTFDPNLTGGGPAPVTTSAAEPQPEPVVVPVAPAPAATTAPRLATPQPRRPHLGPAPAAPGENAQAETGIVELAGSEGRSEQASAPAGDGPKVALRVRLAATPDRKAAEARLERLRAAGLGGSIYQSRDGLDYWIVQSRVLTSRDDAQRALRTVLEMGYEAWLN